MIHRPTSTHATVLGLIRQARTSGEFTDEFALAALIDAEVDLEPLVTVVPPLSSPAPLSARECVEQAIRLIEDDPTGTTLVGWLHEALAGLPS